MGLQDGYEGYGTGGALEEEVHPEHQEEGTEEHLQAGHDHRQRHGVEAVLQKGVACLDDSSQSRAASSLSPDPCPDDFV